MARTTLLQSRWDDGMRRDRARNDMPPGSLWNAVDVISQYGAPLRQRGGWVTHTNAGASLREPRSAGVYATFVISGSETSKALVVADGGISNNLYDVTSNPATSIGAAVTVKQNPVFHGGVAANTAGTAVYTGLVIIPDGTGAAVPKKYDGTTLGNLQTGTPFARYATIYKDYTVLGNGTVSSVYYPDRIWFSPEGDPDCETSGRTAWDTTDSWMAFPKAVKGLGATRNALLAFHDSSTSRVRGSIPPPDEDMVKDDELFSVGLYDAFSIANHRDTVIWASEEGIFRTDGAILDDLTKRGGMSRYWLDLCRDATSTWRFSGGVLRDTYFLSVVDSPASGAPTFKDAFMIDLTTLSWTRLQNVMADCFFPGQYNKADELYWKISYATTVPRMSTIYKVGDGTYKTDGTGNPAAVVETPYYLLDNKPGLKRIRRAYTSVELTDYATDNPTCALSYILTPEETAYTALGTLSEGTEMQRKRFDINRQAQGIAFKYTRTNNGDFLLYDLELEQWPREQTAIR